MDVTSRLAALRARLGDSEYRGFVARAVPNVTYLTGFDGVWDEEPAGLVLITETDFALVTDSRYSSVAFQSAGDGPLTVHVAAADLWERMSELLVEVGVRSLAVESSLPFSVVQRVRDLLPIEVTPVADWVESLRCSKDHAEIDRVAAAQDLTDDAFDHILAFISAGMTETQIALELEFYMRSNGSDGIAFPPIVASGPNSALPHAHPGSRRVARGDFLKMDFGARVGGYCADMTRTIVIGAASARQREMYAAVRAANLAGIAAVRPGRSGRDIDAAARSVIAAAGFAENFVHGLGHGVGLEVHEQPGLGARSEGLVPLGSVVTVEPGVYVPGFGGVRIEDLVVVEETGARVLTRSTKELIEL
jgi:Xaa-Pro aminopeptidase